MNANARTPGQLRRRARDYSILSGRSKGLSLRQLAALFQISPARVHQIVGPCAEKPSAADSPARPATPTCAANPPRN